MTSLIEDDAVGDLHAGKDSCDENELSGDSSGESGVDLNQ